MYENLNLHLHDSAPRLFMHIILIRYGELSLKSRYVRNQFERRLIQNIKHVFALNHVSCDVFRERGRIYLHTDNVRASSSILKKIFGITSFSEVIATTSTLDHIARVVLQLSDSYLDSEKSFALRVTRIGTHEYTSQDIAVKLGKMVCEKTKARVDLTKPDVEIFIEIRGLKAYIFTEKIRGLGGLPVGTQGRVLALVEDSDSLAAAWFLMRRGCQLDFIVLNPDIQKQLDDFCTHWYITAKCLFLTDFSSDTYAFLNEHASRYAYDAFVVGDRIRSSQDIERFFRLKENLCLPVLHPLVAVEANEIQKQLNIRGVDG